MRSDECQLSRSKVIEHIRLSWSEGRAIVPFLGAGASVSAGIPSITMLNEYFAKLLVYIRCGLYMPTLPADKNQVFRRETYQRDPSQYIERFGWPGFCQLNEEMWLNKDVLLNEDVLQNFEFSKVNRDKLGMISEGQDIRKEILYPNDSFAQLGFRYCLTKVEKDLNKVNYEDENIRLEGNWHILLNHLTGGNPDLVDSLFRDLVKGHRPGATHVYLSFLSQLMNWPLFLTINFDDLMEGALAGLGFEPEVFSIARDAQLPTPELVRKQLSVIKLHGGAYGLRTGERLDNPLDASSRERILKYLPESSTLLVIGFGGGERRMLEMIEEIARSGQSTNHADIPRVIWLHLENSPSESIKGLWKRLGNEKIHRLRTCKINDSGSFLAELYHSFAGVHPVARNPYRVESFRPQPNDSTLSDDNPSSSDSTPPAPLAKVNVFSKLIYADKSQKKFHQKGQQEDNSESSLAMSSFIASLAPRYIPIWINTEKLHTVSALTDEILNQLRVYDPSLPRLALPVDQQHSVTKAVTTIRRALRRRRYALALDSLQCFGRPQTVHHGIPLDGDSSSHNVSYIEHIKDLFRFLSELCDIPSDADAGISPPSIGDSIICLSLEDPQPRRDLENTGENYDSVQKEIRDFLLNIHNRCVPRVAQLHSVPTEPDGVSLSKYDPDKLMEKFAWAPYGKHELDAAYPLLLPILCMFREPITIVAVRSMVSKLLKDKLRADVMPTEREIDKYISTDLCKEWAFYSEGGFIWMGQRTRNKIYKRISEQAYDDKVLTLKKKYDKELLRKSLIQLYWLSFYHRRIARYYYSDQFLATRDIWAFFEYLYHRISSLRSLNSIYTLVRKYENKCKQYRSEQKLEDRPDPNDLENNVFSDYLENSNNILEDILRDLDMLSRTLQREREWLHVGVPGDTLSGWIDRILTFDIDRIAPDAQPARKGNKKQNKIIQEIFRTRDEFKHVLMQDKAKVLREKSDFLGCIDVRLQQIKDDGLTSVKNNLTFDKIKARSKVDSTITALVKRLNNATDRLSKKPKNKVDIKLLEQFVEYVRDIVVCCSGLRARYGDTSDLANDDQMLLDRIEALLKAKTKSNRELLNQTSLPLLYRKATISLFHLDPWKVKGLSPASNRGRMLIEKQKESCKKTRKLRVRGGDIAGQVQPHRPDEFYEYRSYYLSLLGRADSMTDRYSEALRLLECAAAGLSNQKPTHRLAMAVAHHYRAECLMLNADSIIEDLCYKMDDSTLKSVYSRANRKLEAAERALQQSFSLMNGARRNTFWWLQLYLSKAQLQIEQMLLELTAPTHLLARPRSPAELSARLNNYLAAGLQAVRGAFDSLFVEHQTSHLVNNEERSIFLMWLKLLVCGCYMSIIELENNEKNKSNPHEFFKQLWERWRWMNRSAGITKIVESEKIRRILTKHIETNTSLVWRGPCMHLRTYVLGQIASILKAKDKNKAEDEKNILDHLREERHAVDQQ